MDNVGTWDTGVSLVNGSGPGGAGGPWIGYCQVCRANESCVERVLE